MASDRQVFLYLFPFPPDQSINLHSKFKREVKTTFPKKSNKKETRMLIT
jgi:hypothetical protein